MQTSKSENNGLSAITDTDLRVYSVGVSTAGVAKIRMARQNPDRKVIATTVDKSGLKEAKKRIASEGLSGQIELKLEDVAEPLPYEDEYFDFIYARLVLHYLPKQKLEPTLRELFRVLRPKGRIYVVVRSNKCPDAVQPDALYDPRTHLTTHIDAVTSQKRQRYFHTKASIKGYLEKAGFTVEYVKSYDERLYADFMRTVIAPHVDNVIEILATKG